MVCRSSSRIVLKQLIECKERVLFYRDCKTRRFEQALSQLPEAPLKGVEDEIDNTIEDPEIGELKKGDL